MHSPASTYSFALYGIHLAITCDSAIADALFSRLGYFAAAPVAAPDITFVYETVPDAAEHRIERPPKPTRPVYDPPLGEIVYEPDGAQLYMNYGDRVRVLCDLRQGRAYFSTVAEAQSNLWLLTHPLFTLALTEFLKFRGLYALHTAALSLDGKGILFAGTSGAGKSTLTLALLRDGFDFLADDLVFLGPRAAGVRVHAFPEEIDLTDETVRMFPELETLLRQQPAARVAQAPNFRRARVDARIVAECEPTILIIPRVAGTDRSKLEPLTASEALMELVPNVLLTEAQSSQAHLDVLAELAKQCACYRLETGRDLSAVAAQLRALVTR